MDTGLKMMRAWCASAVSVCGSNPVEMLWWFTPNSWTSVPPGRLEPGGLAHPTMRSTIDKHHSSSCLEPQVGATIIIEQEPSIQKPETKPSRGRLPAQPVDVIKGQDSD